MTNRLDTVTAQVTAFSSYAALLARCATGYVPTITGQTSAHEQLRRALRASGFKSWDGR